VTESTQHTACTTPTAAALKFHVFSTIRSKHVTRLPLGANLHATDHSLATTDQTTVLCWPNSVRWPPWFSGLQQRSPSETGVSLLLFLCLQHAHTESKGHFAVLYCRQLNRHHHKACCRLITSCSHLALVPGAFVVSSATYAWSRTTGAATACGMQSTIRAPRTAEAAASCYRPAICSCYWLLCQLHHTTPSPSLWGDLTTFELPQTGSLGAWPWHAIVAFQWISGYKPSCSRPEGARSSTHA
jgi:hypothetical protein